MPSLDVRSSTYVLARARPQKSSFVEQTPAMQLGIGGCPMNEGTTVPRQAHITTEGAIKREMENPFLYHVKHSK